MPNDEVRNTTLLGCQTDNGFLPTLAREQSIGHDTSHDFADVRGAPAYVPVAAGTASIRYWYRNWWVNPKVRMRGMVANVVDRHMGDRYG